MTESNFDIVVWGATGFTGRLVVEHLYQTYGAGGNLRWAVAARNQSKLTAVKRDILGEDADKIPEVIADSSDESSLRSLVNSTQVVLSTVGPYALYGTLLVKLCAETGTHYCDLTGEVPWMRSTIDSFHDIAQNSGARIVHACGFDSIPSDLGVQFIQNKMLEQTDSYATQVSYRLGRSAGGLSGGTIASMLNIMEQIKHNKSLLNILTDPYSLNPKIPEHGCDTADQTRAVYDPDFQQWTAPFVMAPINTRVVRRTHALLGQPWGQSFHYNEALLAGKGLKGCLKANLAATGTALTGLFSSFKPTRQLLARFLPKPGEGPSRETIENGYFEIELLAKHPDNSDKNIRVQITGNHDPGYGSTSRMIAESAVCLARDELTSPGGVLTPAFTMGDHLINRLIEHAGITFTILNPEQVK